MGRIYFISGIDTGIGKTVVTGLIARSLRARGVDALTVKLVQTGNDGYSEDIDAHRAICGGELAGHYYFRDFVHCDSGELAALRILSAFAAAKRKGQRVSAFMAPLLTRYANSGEVNFEVPDKPAAIARVLDVAKTLASETGRSEIDGYRLEYAEGWISVRQSNTEPLLRLIVECDSRARMENWLNTLSERM